MFQFGRFPTYTYVFSIRSMILHHGGFPIRKSTDRSLFAAPRSLSQLVTSFIGSWCQGIPLALLLAWPCRTAFQLLSSIRIMQASVWLHCSFVTLNSYIKSPQKFVLCYLSVACSQFLACFTVQFSRCRFSVLFQEQIEMFFAEHFNLSLTLKMVEIIGIEPMTPCLQGRCSPSWAIPPYLRHIPSKLNNVTSTHQKFWP